MLGSAGVLAPAVPRGCPLSTGKDEIPMLGTKTHSACLQRAVLAHLSLKESSQPSYQTLGSYFHTGLLYLDSRFPLDPKSHTKRLKVFSLLAKENTEDFI